MNSTEQLSKELNKTIADGTPWVVYNDRSKNEPGLVKLYFFKSVIEAEKFCERKNNQIDVFADDFRFEYFICTPVENLRIFLGFKQEAAVEEMDMLEIARQMSGQDLFLPPGKSLIEIEDGLRLGLKYPLLRQRSIDPLKEIAEYNIVTHRHRGGTIYEIGHSHKVLESFSSFKDASSFMNKALHADKLADNGADYLIVGRFNGQNLELDREGYALPHSGLAIVKVWRDYNGGYRFQQLHSLLKQVTIDQYFFAGIINNELRLYNDRLEKTSVSAGQLPFYPEHFNNDYLTFKNSIIMNEQSFDYVKNQLFYLGFGDEVAKPLREKMEQNLTEFQISHSRKFGQDETTSVLHFSKGDQKDKDMTFFNRADVMLKQPGKEDLTQTFFFGKEHNYTLQERYNMMDGRAAYREQPKMAPAEENGEVRMKPTGETYYAWRGLDFKNADQYGNFNPKVMFWNHQKEVGKYPIKGIEENYDKQRLIAKLEKGNKVDVVLVRDGHETLAKMVANPRMARLDFYDSNGQSLIVRKVEKQAVEQTQKAAMTPQEVQKDAIARAAEQKQETSQPVAAQDYTNNQEQAQKETVNEHVANEQKQDQRRRQGARI